MYSVCARVLSTSSSFPLEGPFFWCFDGWGFRLGFRFGLYKQDPCLVRGFVTMIASRNAILSTFYFLFHVDFLDTLFRTLDSDFKCDRTDVDLGSLLCLLCTWTAVIICL